MEERKECDREGEEHFEKFDTGVKASAGQGTRGGMEGCSKLKGGRGGKKKLSPLLKSFLPRAPPSHRSLIPLLLAATTREKEREACEAPPEKKGATPCFHQPPSGFYELYYDLDSVGAAFPIQWHCCCCCTSMYSSTISSQVR